LISCFPFADVKTKWENSSWGKKLIVQKRRAALNDFDRFKVMLAKIKVGKLRVKCFSFCCHCHYCFLTLMYCFLMLGPLCKQRGGAVRQELAKLKKASTA